MTKLDDYEHSFKACNGVASCCRIRIFAGAGDQGGMTVVIASQLPEGDERTGMSVTNAAEQIASEVSRKFNIESNRLLFIEHYPERGHRKQFAESFDRVTFASSYRPHHVFRSPNWFHISRETVEKWIGGAL